MKGEISILQAVNITVISMAIVFFILALISCVLSLFKFIPAEKKAEAPKKAAPAPAPAAPAQKAFDPSSIRDDSMLAAMLVASIEASEDMDGANIRVRSIKELN